MIYKAPKSIKNQGAEADGMNLEVDSNNEVMHI